MASDEIQWNYAVAAGVLTREEVEYIKEEEKEEGEGEDPTESSVK